MNFTKWWTVYEQIDCEEADTFNELSHRWRLSAALLREPGVGEVVSEEPQHPQHCHKQRKENLPPEPPDLL